VPATAAGLLQQGQKQLRLAGIDTAELDARLLLQEATGWSHARLISAGEDAVTPAAISIYEQFLARRLGREPVSKIIGHREFWSLEFVVNKSVLDPRPDTETLVEAVLTSIKNKSAPLTIVDLGTGSGCILVALMTELPNARGIAVDRSPDALAVAKQNAQHHAVADRIAFICASWGEALPDECCDIVVSNPPYIETDDLPGLSKEVLDHDPALALDGGDDGLTAYRQIAADLPRLLAPGGQAFLELGIGQGPDVSALLEGAGASQIRVTNDLAGIGRCISCHC
jgi:release factor glutamine methyltransferase